MMQPISSDDVAAVVANVALTEPLNNTIETAGPDPIRQDELVRQFLEATGDLGTVVTVANALYYNIALNDRSLTPGDNPLPLPVDFQPIDIILLGPFAGVRKYAQLTRPQACQNETRRASSPVKDWRDGRAVYCTGLENRRSARIRGFESHSLRQIDSQRLTAATHAFQFHLVEARQVTGVILT